MPTHDNMSMIESMENCEVRHEAKGRSKNSPHDRQVAETAGFMNPVPQLVRGRRTGRNMQINLKARPDTIEAFTAIADANGWGLGETLERAVILLEREFGRG